MVYPSYRRKRNNPTCRRALSIINNVLNNAIYVEKHNDDRHGSDKRYIELYAAIKNGNVLNRFRIIAKEGDKSANEFNVKSAEYYDIIRAGVLSANVPESTLPASVPHGTQGQVSRNTPLTVSVAELLKDVKDRAGNPYIDANGKLVYDTKALAQKRLSAREKSNKIAVTTQAKTLKDKVLEKGGAMSYLKSKKDELYKDWIDKNDTMHSFDEAVAIRWL
ncbi:MAG: hypothetical protein SPI71_03725 [Acidaminococcaceae bacterium]|nr:hypothetical protein [Acidaminococcaceae bacterium]